MVGRKWKFRFHLLQQRESSVFIQPNPHPYCMVYIHGIQEDSNQETLWWACSPTHGQTRQWRGQYGAAKNESPSQGTLSSIAQAVPLRAMEPEQGTSNFPNCRNHGTALVLQEPRDRVLMQFEGGVGKQSRDQALSQRMPACGKADVPVKGLLGN